MKKSKINRKRVFYLNKKNEFDNDATTAIDDDVHKH